MLSKWDSFYHCYCCASSSRAYEIEKRLSTADLFKFPNFETICWYVGKHILDIFRGMKPFANYPFHLDPLNVCVHVCACNHNLNQDTVLCHHHRDLPSATHSLPLHFP